MKDLKWDCHLPKSIYFLVASNASILHLFPKMMKNAFYFILKDPFVAKIFEFLSRLFAYVEKTA